MRVVAFVLIFGLLFRRVLCDLLEFRYHTNEELKNILQEFNETVKSPLRVNVYTIGSTYDENELWVAEITAVKEGVLKVPNVKLIGNIHGNEVVGREVLLNFLHFLRDEYHKGNTTITSLLNTTRIHIFPAMNPDGFARSKMYCGNDTGRQNGKGHVDLNRSFPDYYYRNRIKPQPETVAVMEWMERTPFILSASLHGGAVVANYPFDTIEGKSSNYHLEDYSSLTPDDDVFKHLSKTYSTTHKEMYLGNYCSVSGTHFEGGITNGAVWYTFIGGMQDYNYFKHGCMEITLEISCCKYPNADQLEKFWHENKEALIVFCQQAHRGIYGQVLDRETQHPIGGAQMEIMGRAMSFSSFNSTGEFWRILLPGEYTIKVQAPGYHAKYVPFKISSKHLKLEMDIYLTNSSVSTTPVPFVLTSETKQTQKSLSSPTYFNDPAQNISILCELSDKRVPRSRECSYPEVGQILNTSARSCFLSVALLIVVVLLFFI